MAPIQFSLLLNLQVAAVAAFLKYQALPVSFQRAKMVVRVVVLPAMPLVPQERLALEYLVKAMMVALDKLTRNLMQVVVVVARVPLVAQPQVVRLVLAAMAIRHQLQGRRLLMQAVAVAAPLALAVRVVVAVQVVVAQGEVMAQVLQGRQIEAVVAVAHQAGTTASLEARALSFFAIPMLTPFPILAVA
jgi:hypothetical protein